MRPEHWRLITELAAVQHGLVTRAQILGAGAAPRTLTRALDGALLVRVRRQVYLVEGVPPSVWQPVMAACLAGAPYAFASHRAAAGLYRLPGIVPGAVEVLTARESRRSLHGSRCHTTLTLSGDDVGLVRNIPVVSPARTIVDLASLLQPRPLATIVEHACRRGLCTAHDLLAALAKTGGRGRAGCAVLRSVLSDRVQADSALEATWLRRLRHARLRPPALQHQVVVGSRVLLVDFAWPEQRVGMEVDGWEPHRERSSFDRDHDKSNAYAEAGWTVLFVTSRTSPQDVFRQLRRFLREK